MTGFSVHGVHKSFGASPVLRGIDLEIGTGTLTAILGASGSGKTTLLRILAGFERADAGIVTIGGVTVDDGRRYVAPERRRVGYVPQEGALFPHLTVAGNVGFGVRRPDRARVTDLINLVGLDGFGARYPHQLSGGQQQRVALARALATAPALVLLDEPFSSLDAALRASVRADVAQVLRTTGATALLVTHDQDEALSMADRVAVLRDGVIAQVGSPHELYDRPRDADLARFLGEANTIAGVAAGGVASTALGPVATHSAAAEGAVTVLLRPEQITITAGDRGEGVRGHVTELRYFGHDTILRVRPADSSTDIRVRISGVHDLAPGDRVTVTVQGTATTWPVE